MRTKDENKIKAIKTAVIDLCQADGFTNLTTAKVAKRAGVSPATIYLYYQGKTDLLSRLYEEVKDDLQKGLAGAIAQAGPETAAQIRAMLNYSITQVQQHPKESHFSAALWTNQELLDDQARAHGNTEAGPLMALYQQIQADPAFIDAPAAVIATFSSVPSMLLQTANSPVSTAMLQQTVDLVLKALQK